MKDPLCKVGLLVKFLLRNGAWRNLVAHLPWEQGVSGSNPFAPTIRFFIFNSVVLFRTAKGSVFFTTGLIDFFIDQL